MIEIAGLVGGSKSSEAVVAHFRAQQRGLGTRLSRGDRVPGAGGLSSQKRNL